MKYIAMDFEIGNALYISACSIGLSYYEDDKLLRTETYLIRPPASVGKFHWYNVKLHGIKQKMLQTEPTFDEIWGKIASDFENSILICHNAVFDTAVLKACLDFYGLAIPNCEYVCTVQISQKVWPDMVNHKLDTVANDLGIPLCHHEAGSDAFACGEILQAALRVTGCADVISLAKQLKIPVGKLSQAGVRRKEKNENKAAKRHEKRHTT